MDKKVYCRDCKYFREFYCNYPDNYEWKDNPLNGEYERIKSYVEINRKNNCNWFIPKWNRKRKYNK